MQIQFNTDKNIEGEERLETFMSEKITKSLDRFSEWVTRIEVHLSDQNAHKSGADDMQCTLEARIKGQQPIAVTSNSDIKEKAINDAIGKMKAALDTRVGKLRKN